MWPTLKKRYHGDRANAAKLPDFARRRFCAALFFLSLYSVFIPASLAQSVFLRPENVFPLLQQTAPEASAFFINGSTVHWGSNVHWRDDTQETVVSGLEAFILSLAALRMMDAGLLDPSERLHDISPLPPAQGLYSDSIRIQHLLTSSGGFATPPNLAGASIPPSMMLSGAAFADYMITMRSPGRLPTSDPVGWATLARILEQKGEAPLLAVLTQYVFEPLGIKSTDIHITFLPFSGENMPFEMLLSRRALNALLVGVIRNRTANDMLFLTAQRYSAWQAGAGGLRLNPGAPIAGYGLQYQDVEGVPLITFESACMVGLALVYVPHIDTVFGILPTHTPPSCHALEQVSATIAADALPPPTPNNPRNTLKEASDLSGTYIPAGRTPASLPEKLSLLSTPPLFIKKVGADYSVRQNGQTSPYRQTQPYSLQSADPQKENLLFSPYRAGGYVMQGGALFRRVDSLIYAGWLFDYMPLMLITLLSAIFYMRTAASPVARNMGKFATAGSSMLALGLMLELLFWAKALYVWQTPYLIIAWRLILNLGLMACLSMPFYAAAVVRGDRDNRPVQNPLIRLHMLAVGVTALAILMVLTALGITGRFGIY